MITFNAGTRTLYCGNGDAVCVVDEDLQSVRAGDGVFEAKLLNDFKIYVRHHAGLNFESRVRQIVVSLRHPFLDHLPYAHRDALAELRAEASARAAAVSELKRLTSNSKRHARDAAARKRARKRGRGKRDQEGRPKMRKVVASLS